MLSCISGRSCDLSAQKLMAQLTLITSSWLSHKGRCFILSTSATHLQATMQPTSAPAHPFMLFLTKSHQVLCCLMPPLFCAEVLLLLHMGSEVPEQSHCAKYKLLQMKYSFF